MSGKDRDDQDGDAGGIPPLKSEKVTKVSENERASNNKDGGLTHGGAPRPDREDRKKR